MNQTGGGGRGMSSMPSKFLVCDSWRMVVSLAEMENGGKDNVQEKF